ncbi:hypothetical protein N825_30655 [Skermanella stibiiresistens SB22]|uniref:Uncharacterized protein n=1 Tax=Skermanella stibiiresistens SB22 TaxID=1385369 RepID=W9HBH8_9PROT|nr:hypothetical protein [Skermanella stibiiresistens]EWY41223.1 hypothetical protein N825_30655 [Skermanella stibiiresistens SB22]
MTAQAALDQEAAFGLHAWQRDYALRTLEVYVSEVENRVFTAFEQAGEIGNQFAEDGESVPPARQAGIDQWYEEDEHRKDLAFAKDRIIEMAVAGLYHLWERRAVHMLRLHELSRSKSDDGKRKAAELSLNDFGEIRAQFERLGWDLEIQPFYKKLNKLRLVTNAVKHGPGPAMTKLWRKCPTLFWPYNEPGHPIPADLPAEPSSANTLDLTADHFRDYARAVEAFWKAVPIIDRE